jgi:hypothetical protein
VNVLPVLAVPAAAAFTYAAVSFILLPHFWVYQASGKFDMKEPYYRQLTTWAQTQQVVMQTQQQQQQQYLAAAAVPGLTLVTPQQQQQQHDEGMTTLASAAALASQHPGHGIM